MTTNSTTPSGKYVVSLRCEHCAKPYASRLALAKHTRIKHPEGK